MMKSIDNVYNLIYILSDAGCFDQGEISKVGRFILDRRKICQKIGHRAEGSIDISAEGFGP